MANGATQTIEQKVLEWIFKQTTFGTSPTTLYIALHSADPGDTGASELSSTGSYARAAMPPDTNNSTNTHWNAIDQTGVASKMTNKEAITFPTATADWNGAAAIHYFSIWDTVSGGACLWSGSISGGGVIVLNGNTLSFAAGSPGALSVTID